ncbi:MAG TPA: NUDIX domain-containing protein [Acidimicrobiia bacterium]|jgi:predicted NUDIX family NTP pyrophosphohydrolase|nr:NUDIX domain-containing protein [Acidimicrobiia bacterium]
MNRPADVSAGVLLYRRTSDGVEVLIAHPGGPYWAKRHEGAWSIPKGLVDEGEDHEAAARREFEEETGHASAAPAEDLGSVKLKSGKEVHAYAIEGDLDPEAMVSNTFMLEWPPRSGRMVATPEIDRVAWCLPGEAKQLLNPAQAPFVDRLVAWLEGGAV